MSRRSGGAAAGSIDTAPWREPKAEPPPLDALRGRDGVVHLLGEPIAQRWTEESKREILDSRVLATRNLVAALAELPSAERPGVLVSQSAVGWYGPRGPEPLDESAPAGDDFQARVVAAWEAEARTAEELEGLRVVLARTGVVLSPSGGALEKMLPFFKLGIGGPVAGGKQYLPWVHLDDVVGALILCLDSEDASGAINLTAPQPVTNAEFSKALGRVLKRPAVLPVPTFAIKTLYGQMAEIVTEGANVRPQRLQAAGLRLQAARAGAGAAQRPRARLALLLLLLVQSMLLGTQLGDGLALAADRPLELPARIGLRRPQQPDHDADGAQQQPEREPPLLAPALAGGEVRGDDRGSQPEVGQPQRRGSDDCEVGGHAPRYAFCTSGFSRSDAEASSSATLPVSSTYARLETSSA